jgi:hypothetical protein
VSVLAAIVSSLRRSTQTAHAHDLPDAIVLPSFLYRALWEECALILDLDNMAHLPERFDLGELRFVDRRDGT